MGFPSVSSSEFAEATNMGIAAIIGIIVSIIGAVLIVVLFLNKDNEKKYTGFVKTLYNFLQFNTLCIEAILKFTYILFAIFLTILSFGMISSSFIGFLMFLILGHLFLRVAYELTLLTILIHRNVREINENLKK